MIYFLFIVLPHYVDPQKRDKGSRHPHIGQIHDKATELEGNKEHEPRHQMQSEGLLEDNTGPLIVNAQVHHTADASTTTASIATCNAATANAATANVSTTTPAVAVGASTTTPDVVATTTPDVVSACTSNAFLGSDTSSLCGKNILLGLFFPSKLITLI